MSAGSAGDHRLMSRRRLPALMLLCGGLALAEEIALVGFGVRSGYALAPQVSAAPPFGVFHDLRWVMVFHSGYGTFAAFMVGLFVVRTAIVTALVQLAWPATLPRPSLRHTAFSALAFVALAVVFLTPSATVLFSGALTSLWPFFLVAGAMAVPVLALFWYPAFPGWWRRLPPWRGAAWVVVDGLVLTIASLAISYAPSWVALAPAAAAGVFNALAWYGIADAVAHRLAGGEVGHRPVGLALPTSLSIGAVAAAAAGFAVAIWLTTPTLPKPRAHPVSQPVIDLHGFRSSFDGRARNPLGRGFIYRRFSYRGLGPQDTPLAYRPRATYESLTVSAAKQRVQVAALHARTGKKVDLVADSEGAMVAKLYLELDPRAPVKELVMTSPLLRPASVRYPPFGSNGWGIATRFALRREAALMGTALPVSVRMPLLASMVDEAPLLRQRMLCPLPGVAQSAFIPLVNALAVPPPVSSGIPLTVLPTVHGAVGSPERDRRWLELTPRQIPHFTAWQTAADWVRAAAAGWQVPTLPLSVGWSNATRSSASCSARRAGR